MLSSFVILVPIFLVFAVALVFVGVKTLTQGEQFQFERLGRYNRTLAPRPHLVVPLVARIGIRVGVVDMDGATLMVEAVD
ncbi:MAG: hypothetical protein EVA87_02505 [Rhodospirillaceae bacterium]|nr:MAG: hypothetical protein EVA87_02505 [Rhodospirillaceae bacterium]